MGHRGQVAVGFDPRGGGAGGGIGEQLVFRPRPRRPGCRGAGGRGLVGGLVGPGEALDLEEQVVLAADAGLVAEEHPHRVLDRVVELAHRQGAARVGDRAGVGDEEIVGVAEIGAAEAVEAVDVVDRELVVVRRVGPGHEVGAGDDVGGDDVR